MQLDHERMDVYQVALDFVALADRLTESMPKGRSHLSDQLARASTSIVLNLAEGAGKQHRADKRRYYVAARGSATESAALLDVMHRLGLIAHSDQEAGKTALIRIVSMLTKLARILEGD